MATLAAGVVAASASAAPLAQSRAERARLVVELTAGRLPKGVDTGALFAISLAEPPPGSFPALLRLVEDPVALKAAQRARAAGESSPTGIDELTLAQAEFLTLSADRRRALLEDAALGAPVATDATARTGLAERIATLRGLIAGRRPATVALNDALTIDALDEDEVVLDGDRRRRWLAAYEAARAKAGEEASRAAAEGQAELDRLQAQAVALGAERLASDHGALPQSAAEAQAEQQAALAAAASTASEAIRLVETERAGLLATRRAQAEFEARLVAGADALAAERETALTWRRRVLDLGARSLLDPTRSSDADALYLSLVNSLRDVRARLRAALGDVLAPEQRLPAPPKADEALDATGVDAAPVVALRRRLGLETERLGRLAADTAWERASTLRESMGVMNDARLELIPHLSREQRSRVLGFSADGLAQARRELDQIALETQFNLLAAPRVVSGLADRARAAAAGAVVVGLQILAVLVVFRIWRRQGGRLIRSLLLSIRRRRSQTLLSTLGAMVLTFVHAARRPLDWLILLVLVAWAVPKELRFAGADYVWIAAVWALVGSLAARVADRAWALRRSDRYAVVRKRTVRLVAWTTAMLALALTLARVIVGNGALYHWAIAASWIALFPSAVLLLHWWRERIHALALAGAQRSVVLAWAARETAGPVAFVARAAAAGVLLSRGARAFVIRGFRQVALLRDIFDERQRRRAVAAARADDESGRYEPLPGNAELALASHREAADLTHSGLAGPEDVRIEPGRVLAIVGDCGLGKTTMLSRLAKDWPNGATLAVPASPSWDETLATLGDLAGSRAKGESAVARALRRSPAALVLLDDAHLLIGQGIGGARDFHRMVSFAHGLRETGWAFAVDGRAWDYVSRISEGRVLADRIYQLPRWSDAAVAGLIDRRTRQAGLEPRFEGLEISARRLADAELDREARARAAYFEHLTDFARGNPAVALEFWRRSLRVEGATGRTVVRMFPTPPVEKIEALPPEVHFVLGALVRLDRADEAALVRATSLPAAVVGDAIRRLWNLGALDQASRGAVRVKLFWRREVERVLERRNMLSARAA